MKAVMDQYTTYILAERISINLPVFADPAQRTLAGPGDHCPLELAGNQLR